MGGQSSKSTINSLNERITQIATNSVANCETSSTQDQSQKLLISGIFSSGATATATQSTEINSKCLASDSLIQDLQNQVIDTIGSSVSANGIALLPAFGNTTSDSIVNLNNTIRTSLSKSNISNNYTKMMQKQTQEIENRALFQFGTTLTATQGSKAFAEAVVQSLTDSKVMSTIQTHLEIQASATSNNPLDIIGRAFSSVFGGIATVLGAGAGTVMFIVFALMITIIGALVLLNKAGATRILASTADAVARSKTGTPPKPDDGIKQSAPTIPQINTQQPIVNNVAPVLPAPVLPAPVIPAPVIPL